MNKLDALAALRGRFPILEAGHVWLAGAGPGDPGLLTLDALAGLAQADVIVHDALVDERVLALAGPQATLEYAGKRGGRPSAQQADISRRLIGLARESEKSAAPERWRPVHVRARRRRGHRPRRCRHSLSHHPRHNCGSSALSAASIPATMRGVNHAIIFATGHADGDFDWAALARTGQPIVIYMAMRNVEQIVEALLHGGLAPQTPAAVIIAATTPEQRIAISRLDRLVDVVRKIGFNLPGLIVIGDIVTVRDRLLKARSGPRGRAVSARGFIVSAPRSSSGKTLVTLGLLGALRRKGVAVRAAKSGPDYIDPAFHAAATGAQGMNLDTWAMSPSLVDALIADTTQGAELLVIEGAMGLFDGVPGTPGRSGAASDLAERLGLPVLLILDVSGQSQIGGRSCRGLCLIQSGGARRRRRAQQAWQRAASHADRGCARAARHSGAGRDPARRNAGAAGTASRSGAGRASTPILQRGWRVSPKWRRAISISMPSWRWLRRFGSAARVAAAPLKPPGQRIALASDAAFSFVYAHVLDGWRRAGAEIVPFSPLRDEPPADDCDVCWLPGGYPELHAGTLAAARRFPGWLVRIRADPAVHGECGGYMVLGEGLEDAQGARHAMAGLLGHATSFAKRKLHLGYRQARLLADIRSVLLAMSCAATNFITPRSSTKATTSRLSMSPMRKAGRLRRPAAGAGRCPARSSTPSRAKLISQCGLLATPASANVAMPV